MHGKFALGLALSAVIFGGCAARRPPILTVAHVDVHHLMGD